MSSWKVLILFVACAISVVGWTSPISAVPQAQTPEWQRYRIDGEDFSVLLPVIPAMSTELIYVNAHTTRRERLLGAYADGVVYAIYTFEKKGLSLDDLVRRFSSSHTTAPVMVDGIAGKSSHYEDEDRLGLKEYVATSTNLYVFEASGSKLKTPSARISKFFSSIRFSKIDDGRKVTDGPGDQPISDSNGTQDDIIFTTKQVAVKLRVITKPEPRYTESARMNQTTGTVVLRATFSAAGTVTNIRALSSLPDGLTEKAIEAARQIKFIPGIKDGRFVSLSMQLEYNFNLY